MKKVLTDYQTNAIKIDFNREVPFHIDGELYFSSIFEVSVLPKAVKIIFNPYGNHFFNNELK